MSPTDVAAFARRYRSRHTAPPAVSPISIDNLLWRSPKVPLRREDATEQLELLGPEHFFADLPDLLPDPARLRLERIERTINDTLAGLRPQLTRAVREITMHLDSPQRSQADQQAVDATLEAVQRQLRQFAGDALALKRWAGPNGRI